MSYFMNRQDKVIIDGCWNKYWISKLSRDALETNKQYFDENIEDLREKFTEASKKVTQKDYKLEFSEVKENMRLFTKISNEINLAVNQECIKALTFC
jgi:hypothetical protein